MFRFKITKYNSRLAGTQDVCCEYLASTPFTTCACVVARLLLQYERKGHEALLAACKAKINVKPDRDESVNSVHLGDNNTASTLDIISAARNF